MLPAIKNRPEKGSTPRLEVSLISVEEEQLEEESKSSSNCRISPLSTTLRIASEMSKAKGELLGNT